MSDERSDEELTALDVLRRDGWYQGDYASGKDSSVCMLGARNRAEGRRAHDERRDQDLKWARTVISVISEQFPDRNSAIHEFNDHPDTTFADVELVLEKAQIRLDEAADA